MQKLSPGAHIVKYSHSTDEKTMTYEPGKSDACPASGAAATHIIRCVERRGYSTGICLSHKFTPVVLCTAAALSGEKLAPSH